MWISLLYGLRCTRPPSSGPPGEAWKVAGLTAAGLVVSLVVFVTIRAFAGPAPSTMNREWEEATNEYLKVRHLVYIPSNSIPIPSMKFKEGGGLVHAFRERNELANVCGEYSRKIPNPSAVSRPKATTARARSRARRRRSNRNRSSYCTSILVLRLST